MGSFAATVRIMVSPPAAPVFGSTCEMYRTMGVWGVDEKSERRAVWHSPKSVHKYDGGFKDEVQP